MTPFLPAELSSPSIYTSISALLYSIGISGRAASGVGTTPLRALVANPRRRSTWCALRRFSGCRRSDSSSPPGISGSIKCSRFLAIEVNWTRARGCSRDGALLVGVGGIGAGARTWNRNFGSGIGLRAPTDLRGWVKWQGLLDPLSWSGSCERSFGALVQSERWFC